MGKEIKPVYIPPEGPLFCEKVSDTLKKYTYLRWEEKGLSFRVKSEDENGFNTNIGVYSIDFFDDTQYEEYFSFEVFFNGLSFGFGGLDYAIKFFLITLTENIRVTEIVYSGKVFSLMCHFFWKGEWIQMRNVVIKKPFFPSMRTKEIVYRQNNRLPKDEIDISCFEELIDSYKKKDNE